ncbi:MAG: LON peptidase substrate-binding domain-containing protein [Planctomycetota bacterium]
MSEERLTLNFNKPIRLFPLQSCVLLPYASVPLHIFEPRYRAMLRDALDSDGLIAMAVFDGEAWKKDYEGNPPLRPCVAVGYLARHDRLDDGRYNILLQGLCRARILEELPPHPDGYRHARMEPFGLDDPDESVAAALGEERDAITALLDDPNLAGLRPVAAIGQWLNNEIPTPAFLDLATLTLTQDVDERYAMLAEPDPRRRAAWLKRHLHELRDIVDKAAEAEGPRDADGWPLN